MRALASRSATRDPECPRLCSSTRPNGSPASLFDRTRRRRPNPSPPRSFYPTPTCPQAKRHAADFRLATTVLRTVDDQLRADLRRIGVIVPKAISEIAWQIPAGWSTSEISQAFGEPTRWQWRQMVEVPKSAPDGAAEAAIDAVRRAGGRDVPLVRVIDYAEGRAAQILHRADENESGSVAKLYRFLDESDLLAAASTGFEVLEMRCRATVERSETEALDQLAGDLTAGHRPQAWEYLVRRHDARQEGASEAP